MMIHNLLSDIQLYFWYQLYFKHNFRINQESFKQSKASVFQMEVYKLNTPEMRQIEWLMCLRQINI